MYACNQLKNQISNLSVGGGGASGYDKTYIDSVVGYGIDSASYYGYDNNNITFLRDSDSDDNNLTLSLLRFDRSVGNYIFNWQDYTLFDENGIQLGASDGNKTVAGVVLDNYKDLEALKADPASTTATSALKTKYPALATKADIQALRPEITSPNGYACGEILFPGSTVILNGTRYKVMGYQVAASQSANAYLYSEFRPRLLVLLFNLSSGIVTVHEVFKQGINPTPMYWSGDDEPLYPLRDAHDNT